MDALTYPVHRASPQIRLPENASIRSHELHEARAGTRILKFFLRVSPEEQRRRLLRRIHRPEKNWKFSAGDLSESDQADLVAHRRHLEAQISED